MEETIFFRKTEKLETIGLVGLLIRVYATSNYIHT